MTRNELISIYIKQQKKYEHTDGTIKTYVKHINNFFDSINKEPVDVIRKDVNNYIESKKLASSTKNVILHAISSFYDSLMDKEIDGFADKMNPCYNVKLPKIKNNIKTAPTEEQIKQLLKFSKNSRDKAIIYLYCTSGLRVSELINLTLSQYLNRDEYNTIKILGKGNKEAYIGFNDTAIKYIDEYLLDRKDGCDKLFVSNGNKKMDRTCLSRTIKCIAKKSKAFTDEEIENLSNHSLRHFTATNMSRNGVPIEVIQTTLRHSSIATTERYINNDRDRIAVAVNTFNI